MFSPLLQAWWYATACTSYLNTINVQDKFKSMHDTEQTRSPKVFGAAPQYWWQVTSDTVCFCENRVTGWLEVPYLDFHLGHEQMCPQNDKTAVIQDCPRPKTKKGPPVMVWWIEPCEQAFCQVKVLLCKCPLLHSCIHFSPFCFTD